MKTYYLYYRLLSILSLKLSTITITIAIGRKVTKARLFFSFIITVHYKYNGTRTNEQMDGHVHT